MQINQQIRDPEVRVIDQTGEQLGIMSSKEALDIAENRDLDLVKISPTAQPPVCRIMDYGKYKFDQDKREREARKNQHVVKVKEVKLSFKIDIGDFNTRVRQAEKFLKSGDKVKVSIRFRGREMAHQSVALEVMKRFKEACADFSQVERDAKLEGRLMLMFLVPSSEK